jgi:uncharacterized protein YprB with RNaseH-like and TPR domain
VAELLRLFDAATLLVAYNGRAFDMEVLRSHYEGDEARRQSHLAGNYGTHSRSRDAPQADPCASPRC